MNTSIDRIKTDVDFLAQAPRNSISNPSHHETSKVWLKDQFDALGLNTSLQSFEIPGQVVQRDGYNVVAEPSQSTSAPTILLGAHYDTVPNSPGADDNASGIAAMLECARILSDIGVNDVRYVAFDAEEIQQPVEGLHGSTAFTESLSDEEKPQLAIVFESVGFSSDQQKQKFPGIFRFLFRRAHRKLKENDFLGNSLLILSRGKSIDVSRKLERLASSQQISLPLLPLEVPWWMPVVRNLRRSDHAPFWNVGIPALMLGDTANFRNPYYHTVSDTPSTLNYEFIAKTVDLVVEYAKTVVG